MRTLDTLDDGKTPIIALHKAMTVADKAWNFGEVPTFHLYVHFDDDLSVMGTLTDAEILAVNDEHNDLEEDTEEDNSASVSTNEAKLKLQNLHQYFERIEL